jgi:hypothetical protein
MAQHWIFLTVLGFILAGIFFFGVWWLYGRVIAGNHRGQGLRRRIWFWRRRGRSGSHIKIEHDIPLLERRNSDIDIEDRRVE